MSLIKYRKEMIDEMIAKGWIETWPKTWLGCYQEWQRMWLVKEYTKTF